MLVLALLAPGVCAQEVRRHILALVPGAEPDPSNENAVHMVLETPLNHLGMIVRHHYIETGPPPAEALEGARAVLTWFDSATADVPWLWDWLENEVAPRPIRVIHFGDWGPLSKDSKRLSKWLERFGMEWQEVFALGPYGIDVTLRSKALCAMEADPRLHVVHSGPRSISKANRPWVTTKHETTCHPVVTGPWGAIAMAPWTLQNGTEAQDRRWHLDPFAFFREALGLERVPAPQPAVLNGRRVWYLQVDGDGFESLSSIRPGILAAQIMKEEMFDQYQLPFTVSVIIRSLTDDYNVDKPTPKMKLAREILAMGNVEPASHGVLHTLDWRAKFTEQSKPRTVKWYDGLDNYVYSDVAEVRDSIRFINERLTVRPRRCRVMLWTGEANPLEDAIQAVYDANCANLNGGVYRWDAWHDSVGYVTPWSRRTGRALQVYAGAANENDFEGFFETMPTAFGHIDTTMERTGTGRILKPVDLYIHFYSAETRARFDVVHRLLRKWTTERETTPVHVSTYANAVVSAVETARIERTAEGWKFRNFGDCRSVRINHDPRDIDLDRSTGVLGFRRLDDRLWIHLSQPNAEIFLASTPRRRPHVEQANCTLEDASLTEDGVAVTAVAHNPRLVVVAGFAANQLVTVTVDESRRPMQADDDGRVTVRLAEPGRSRITVAAR